MPEITCTFCGATNAEGVQTCSNCGAPIQYTPPRPEHDTEYGWPEETADKNEIELPGGKSEPEWTPPSPSPYRGTPERTQAPAPQVMVGSVITEPPAPKKQRSGCFIFLVVLIVVMLCCVIPALVVLWLTGDALMEIFNQFAILPARLLWM